MSKEIATVTFDYSDFEKDSKSKLIYLAGEISKTKRKHAESGLEIGKAIHDAHAILSVAGQDGQFAAWVEAECGFSRQTAYNYMWTWERFGNCKSLLQFTSEALYTLASPKVPEQAVNEAVKLADKGHRIDKETATEVLNKFRDLDKRTKPASVSGSRPPSNNASPQALPSEGTANQADQGSQGSGDAAGVCLHGGDHEWDKEACVKCHEPRPKITGGTTFNVEELTNESKDAFGKDVDGELSKVFELCEEFDEQRNKLTSIKSWMTQRQKHAGAAILADAMQRIKSDIDNADAELRYAKPYCVCVYCKNKSPKCLNCNACKGLGWITEPIFKQAPEEMRVKAKG